MGTESVTQYMAHCDICLKIGVLNQGDGKVWTLKEAKESWRKEGWKFNNNIAKCPECSSNLNKESQE